MLSCGNCWEVNSVAEKTNVPEIRFAGFTDPWEQRKLGEIAPVTMGQSPNGACYTDNPNDVVLVQGNADLKDGWVSPRVWTTEITKTAKSGDLIMSIRAPVGAMGKTTYDVVLGRGVAGIVGNEFLFQALSKKEAEGYWSTVSAGSTFDSINGDELRSTPIDCPRSETECEAIGNCLSKVDYLITLHQRKLNLLKNTKKSMLDKMFPKPGETEPEIRFAGFTDPWEQRKFSDLTDRISIQSSDSDLPQVEYEDIIPGEGTLNKELRDKEGGKTGIKFYAGDVLYGKLRPYLMNYLYPQFNGVAVGDFWVLRAAECDSSFLYRLVQTGSFQRLANVSSGSKMPRADWNLISQSFLAVPANHAEQKAIAKSLADLDNLITLHQRKLNLLKNTKKSLLDRMFV